MIACGGALIVLLPVFLIAIIGILISDWGPVFYCANRIGKDNKSFRMYKFRSMTIAKDADEKSFKADTNRIFNTTSLRVRKRCALSDAVPLCALQRLMNCLSC